MLTLVQRTAPLLIASLALFPALQKRSQPAGPDDFKRHLEGAKNSFEEGKFGACVKHLSDASTIAHDARAQAIRDALPAAPEGYTLKAEKAADNLRNNVFAAAMIGATGNMIERTYIKPGEDIKVTITVDSPMVQMLSMAFTNPAMMDGEPIEYNDDRAVLKKQGNRLNLQILIAKKHVCEVKYDGSDEDFLFKVFDQAAVDKLSAALEE